MNPYDLYPHFYLAELPWLSLPVYDIADNGAETIRFTIASTVHAAAFADARKFAQAILAVTGP